MSHNFSKNSDESVGNKATKQGRYFVKTTVCRRLYWSQCQCHTYYHHSYDNDLNVNVIHIITILLLQDMRRVPLKAKTYCMLSTHAHKPKFPAKPWNVLDVVSAKLPASANVDYLNCLQYAEPWHWALKTRLNVLRNIRPSMQTTCGLFINNGMFFRNHENLLTV